MNVAPMILRFCSGSVTPARRSRNSVDASTNTSGSFNRSKRVRICAASSSRSTPLSTKMQVSRSPIARCRMSAATVESTPPLSAADDAPAADLRANPRRRFLDKRRHRPVARAPADAVREVAQDVQAAFRVHDLRMEQQRVEPPARHRPWPPPAHSRSWRSPKTRRAERRRNRRGSPRPGSPRGRRRRAPAGPPAGPDAPLPPPTVTSAWPNSRCGAGATEPPSEAAISCMP